LGDHGSRRGGSLFHPGTRMIADAREPPYRRDRPRLSGRTALG
jgi:hypothetical protein